MLNKCSYFKLLKSSTWLSIHFIELLTAYSISLALLVVLNCQLQFNPPVNSLSFCLPFLRQPTFWSVVRRFLVTVPLWIWLMMKHLVGSVILLGCVCTHAHTYTFLDRHLLIIDIISMSVELVELPLLYASLNSQDLSATTKTKRESCWDHLRFKLSLILWLLDSRELIPFLCWSFLLF